MASYFPPVGVWYKDNETGQRFEVVAIDEKYKTIEVQFYDGNISEYDIESWGTLKISEIETPEDVMPSFEEYGGSIDHEMDFLIQGNPIDMIEPESFNGFDDLY